MCRHIKGTDNTVADSLSRRADYEAAEKTLQPFLKRNGKVLERIDVIENIIGIIKNTYNLRLLGY